MTQRPYDREPVLDASVDDLNLDIIQETMHNGRELDRLDGITTPWEYLERFSGITRHGDALYPTVAGVLAFTDAPDRWLPGSGVDIAQYQADPRAMRVDGVAPVPGPTRARIQQIRGPIFHIIDRTVEELRNACTTSEYEGARIVHRLDTPLNVLRELTTNGVVHRDLHFYGAQVRVQIFPGYIEWISPGRLPPEEFPDEVPLTLELLLTAQYARNPTLAQFLFHRGYIEKFGFGLDDVVASLSALGRDAPEFHNDKHSFRVRVMRPVIYDDATININTKEGRQRAILLLFDERPTWRLQEIIQRLGIPRTTLQGDLREMLRNQQLTASGSTHNRVYRLWSDSETPPRLL